MQLFRRIPLSVLICTLITVWGAQAMAQAPPSPHHHAKTERSLLGQIRSGADPSPLRLMPTLGDVPRRIVSLDPTASRTLAALGIGNALVGTAASELPLRGLEAVPRVGTVNAPQIDRILALRPDVVIALPTQHFALSPLIQQGIPVVWLDTATLADIEANIRCLGVLMQRQGMAENLIAQENALLRVVKDKVRRIPASSRPRVVQALGVKGDTLLVPGNGDISLERLRLAGATPLAPGEGDAVALSAAAFTAFAPHYVCTDARHSSEVTALLRRKEWAKANAELLVFNDNYIQYPGVDYGMFALWLTSSLHPTAFTRMDRQLRDDAIVGRRTLPLPFSYVGRTQITRERLFDLPAKTLTLQFTKGQRVASTLHGWRNDVRLIGNHYTPPAGWPVTEALGITAVDARLAELLGHKAMRPLYLHTGVDMDTLVYEESQAHGLRVGVLVTAGVHTNALRAGQDSGSFREHGTINIIALTNHHLSDTALLQAMLVLTEAKTAALQELDIRSCASGLAATGTGTDAIMVVSGEGPTLTMAGGHTKLGELLGRVARTAVLKALAQQNTLTAQRSVLCRLYERRIALEPAGLAPEQASRIAQTVEGLLTDPYYAGFVAAALALADSDTYKTLPDTTAFAQWCLRVASTARGEEVQQLPAYYDATLPAPLRMALNALAAKALPPPAQGVTP